MIHAVQSAGLPYGDYLTDNELDILSSKVNESFFTKTIRRSLSVTCDLESCWGETSLTEIPEQILQNLLFLLLHPLKKVKVRPYSTSSVRPGAYLRVRSSALRWNCHTSAVGGQVFLPNPRLPPQ